MKRLFIIFIIVLLFHFLAACEAPEIVEENGIRVEDEELLIDGQLNIACVEPISFNPIKAKNKSYLDISNLIFNGLFEYNKSQEIVPVLAERIDIDKVTGKSIIKLRDNIFWNDGNKVTSDDIKFTLDTIKKTPDSIYIDNVNKIQSYKIIDEGTLSINFIKPYFNLLDRLCFPIIPKHIYMLYDNILPVGTGPYKVTDYKRLKFMELSPNKYYRKNKDFGIEQIKIIFVDDAHALDPFFQSGEIDVLHASSYDWEKYKEQKDISTYKYVSDGFEFMSINHDNELLSDKTIRQAMMYAINRKALIDKHLLGHAVITDTPIKPGSWLDDGQGIKYNYSKTEAQYILSNAGFSFNSIYRVFERENEGKIQELRFTLITNLENKYRVKAAEDIKKDLEEAGFIIDLKIAPFEEVQNALKDKKYDLILTGLNIKQGLVLDGENYGSYKNEEFDSLIDEMIAKQNSPDILPLVYNKIQKLISEDLPIISLFYKEYALVTRNKVRGVIEPDSINLFRTIGDWYLVNDKN